LTHLHIRVCPQNLFSELYNALIDSVTDVYSDESVLQDYVINNTT